MNAAMTRLSAALGDRYRIERELGAGGMATVYLAEDLKHKRNVAVKVLKPELAAVLGADRFVQEITTTAALQHPHILPLFDSGSADGFLYYVMPFIDGETLRDKLNRETQFGVDEAVRITIEIADALHYAHTHGVIHRDIKPENILLANGRPMVADFGIALAVSAAAGGRMTETGLSLGTPHYMSPEQATAEKDITARSDVYSLGSVLYEMLTGNPPHVGSSAQQIIMRIITEVPKPVADVRRSVRANVAAAVSKSLEKLPADRFESAKAFGDALQNQAFTTSSNADGAMGNVRPAPVSKRKQRVVATGALLALVAASSLAWKLGKSYVAPDVRRPVTFEATMGEPGGWNVRLYWSHTGRYLAMSNPDIETRGILMRDLSTGTMMELPNTRGATSVQFSPDDKWVSFSSHRRLMKVPIAGGPAQLVADNHWTGGMWITGDVLVRSHSPDRSLELLNTTTGKATRLTTVDIKRNEWGHWGSLPIPGTNKVLFTNYAAPVELTRIEAVDIKSGERTILLENAFAPKYVPSGHLLFIRSGNVYAVGLDVAKMKVIGSPVPVLEDVVSSVADGEAALDVSASGDVAYLRKSAWLTPSKVVWVARGGAETDAIAKPGQYTEPRLSPDGRRIALNVMDVVPSLGIYDVGRGVLNTIERSPGAAFHAIWMADGLNLMCTWEIRSYELFSIRVDGSAPPRQLVASEYDKLLSGYSAASNTVAYDENASMKHYLMLASLDGRTTPRKLDSGITVTQPSLSTSGKWVAFTSLVQGQPEVFLRATDGSGGRMQVSNAGGYEPRWTRNDRELVFRQGDAMMSVAIGVSGESVGAPSMLFRGPFSRSGDNTVQRYDVTPDGQRFLMTRSVEQPGVLPLVVTLNWTELLKEKMKQ